jgi:hypothetical protein
LRREHIVTDPAGGVIAVVGHTRWMRADQLPGWERDDCAVVIGKPGDEPALLISSDGVDSRRAQVWVASGAPLGSFRRLGTLRLTFWLHQLRYASADGAPPTNEGRVRPRGWSYLANHALTVIDAAGLEHAHITRRPPTATVERRPTDSPARAPLWKEIRDLSRRPVACEVIDARPDFGWIEHGLLVGLAAVCDRPARRRAFPQSGGG